MSPIPLWWIVLHGAAVWKAALGASLLGGLTVAWARPRMAARRSARAARRQLGLPESVSETRRGARVTLTGRLELADGNGEATDRPLLLRCGDARVRLDGPIEILTGSQEAWPGRLPWAGETVVHRSLAPGDRIRISGVLTEEASDEAPSYRDAAKRWALSDGLVAAFEGAPAVRGPSALVRVPPVMAALLLFLAVFGGGGEIAMSRAAHDLIAYTSGPASTPGTAVLFAMVTPFRRRAALSALVAALDARSEPDLETVSNRAGLHEALGERDEMATILMEHVDPAVGARMAEQERSFALAARGWYAAGQFETAADDWDRATVGDDEAELRFGLGLQLLARRPARAAGVARRLAGAFRAHPARNEALRRWYAARADTMVCLADALDARRGDARAWTDLHADQERPLSAACAVLRVDLFDGAQRLQAIHDLPALADDAYDVPRAWLDLLAAEADPTVGRSTPLPFTSVAEVVAIPNGEPLSRAVPAVERSLAEAHPPRRAVGHRMIYLPSPAGTPASTDRFRRRACVPIWGPAPSPRHAAASAGVFAFLSGDVDTAQAMARRLSDEGGDPFGTELSAVAALPADPAPAEKAVTAGHGEFLHGLLDVVVERDAGALLRALAATPPPDEEEKRAWALAAAGDGAGLAHWLRQPRSQPGTFLRLGAPLVRTGRDDLARWIRWGRHRTSGFRPTEEVVHLANLAAAADALSPSQAQALHDRAARFREAILRRETAVPLAVIERL